MMRGVLTQMVLAGMPRGAIMETVAAELGELRKGRKRGTADGSFVLPHSRSRHCWLAWRGCGVFRERMLTVGSLA
jgi:hypothetical protein